jgi:hypothetical protein
MALYSYSILNKIIRKISLSFAKDFYFFQKLIEGKSVAIVGPANTIEQANYGEYIDNHDIVIRINDAFPLNSALINYTGSKSDILFHGLYDGTSEGHCGKVSPGLWKRNGVKLVIYPTHLKDDEWLIYNFHARNYFFLPFSQVPQKQYFAFENELKARPTTGLSSIFWTLSAKPKKIFITGISFYKKPHLEYYKSGQAIKEYNSNYISKQGVHNVEREFEFFKSLIHINPNIELDLFLKSVINS